MKKEMLEEICQKIAEIILIAFITISLFLLLKYLVISMLKVIAMYYIIQILKFAKIFGL